MRKLHLFLLSILLLPFSLGYKVILHDEIDYTASSNQLDQHGWLNSPVYGNGTDFCSADGDSMSCLGNNTLVYRSFKTEASPDYCLTHNESIWGRPINFTVRMTVGAYPYVGYRAFGSPSLITGLMYGGNYANEISFMLYPNGSSGFPVRTNSTIYAMTSHGGRYDIDYSGPWDTTPRTLQLDYVMFMFYNDSNPITIKNVTAWLDGTDKTISQNTYTNPHRTACWNGYGLSFRTPGFSIYNITIITYLDNESFLNPNDPIEIASQCDDGICSYDESYDSCPEDCCDDDCTGESDNTCHSQCQGYGGCQFFSDLVIDVCTDKSFGDIVCLNDSHTVTCCDATPLSCGTNSTCSGGECRSNGYTDLEIVNIIPIQVIPDVDMVAGKSGYVRVIVRNNGPSNATAYVEAYYNGNSLSLATDLEGNENNRFIPIYENKTFNFECRFPTSGMNRTIHALVNTS
jgi:hypothetical protein